jgi:hypothetical protein
MNANVAAISLIRVDPVTEFGQGSWTR